MEFEEVREGLVKILVPKLEMYKRPDGVLEPAWLPIFYNPRMRFNRDISVLAISAYLKLYNPRRKVLLEPLAGTGVRGLRYSAEVKGIDIVIINDVDPEAYKLMKLNTAINAGVLGARVKIYNMDANLLMEELKHGGLEEYPYIIDIDPFGSPAPFLESALRLIPNRGLLVVTATDTAPLTGSHYRAAKRKYGVEIYRTPIGKEIAVRVLSGYVIRRAATYEKATIPLLVYYADHYVRGFFLVERGAGKTDKILEKLGYIAYCNYCQNTAILKSYPVVKEKPLCSFCGNSMLVLGPVFTGTLCSKEFVEGIKNIYSEYSAYSYLTEPKRVAKYLGYWLSECSIEHPYRRIDMVSKYLGVNMPSPRTVVDKIKSMGFEASLTHLDPRGVKTNCPISVFYDVIRRLHYS